MTGKAAEAQPHASSLRCPQTRNGEAPVDLLPAFRGLAKGFPAAANWLLGGEIHQRTGFASARPLLLMGLYAMAPSQRRLAFMVTTEEEALRGLVATTPGLLIVSQRLERGSSLRLVERAPALVKGLRSVLIADGSQEELVAAGRSRADAVLWEVECFAEGQPLVALGRALAAGQPYRSPAVAAAMEAAAPPRNSWREGAATLTRRELDIVDLLAQGLGDRAIAERLAISYETARSRGKALRRKFGASSRAQVVAKAHALGLVRPRNEIEGF